jgi:hypothetical protein
LLPGLQEGTPGILSLKKKTGPCYKQENHAG